MAAEHRHDVNLLASAQTCLGALLGGGRQTVAVASAKEPRAEVAADEAGPDGADDLQEVSEATAPTREPAAGLTRRRSVR
jgi:hypothetical protein